MADQRAGVPASVPSSPSAVVVPKDATTCRVVGKELDAWWNDLSWQQRMWVYLATNEGVTA